VRLGETGGVHGPASAGSALASTTARPEPSASPVSLGAEGPGLRPPTNAPDLSDPRVAATVGVLLAGVIDPMAFMTGLQGRLREVSTDQQNRDVKVSTQRSESAEESRRISLDKARKAAEKAAAKAPRWVKKLIGAIIAAIATVAAVFTGGASLALAVVAVVLLVAGEVVQALAERGVLDEKNGGIAAAAIKLVAAAIMTVCSFGANSGALAQAAGTIAKVAVDIARYTAQTVQTVQGIRDIHRTKLTLDATNHRLDAEGQTLIVDDENTSIEEAADEMKAIHQRYVRAMRRLRQMLEVQGATADAAIRQMA